MPLSALLLALAAAFVHALWNLLLARARDPEAATAVALMVAVIVFAPVSVFAWGLEREVWPYLAVTSCLQLLYFSLLITAYRKAEVSVVYPVARGVAPTVVLLAGIVVLGHGTSWTQAAGVVLVGLGVLAIRGVRRRGVRGDAAGVVFGLAIAAVIASYTLVDKRGLDYATPIAYLEVSMIAPAVLYAAWVARLRGGAVALRSELNRSSVVAGIATFTAYALVLAALERASAASVAAVRETSVVIATLLAAVVLKEHVTPARLTGAILVACGVAILAAGG
jgi:drug/metabolite transporter (DMT)-like permease